MCLKRILAERCRVAGMLLVFDEIFSGLWRLGTPSAWQRLGVRPDIACYAKLLTGARAVALRLAAWNTASQALHPKVSQSQRPCGKHQFALAELCCDFPALLLENGRKTLLKRW